MATPSQRGTPATSFETVKSERVNTGERKREREVTTLTRFDAAAAMVGVEVGDLNLSSFSSGC